MAKSRWVVIQNGNRFLDLVAKGRWAMLNAAETGIDRYEPTDEELDAVDDTGPMHRILMC